jgi:Fanconi anemia group M protein
MVDDREASGAVVARLRKLGVTIEVKRLPVADFVLSDRVAVERKTAADFESSVVDGRLFEQAGRLKAEFASPLICVVGNDFFRLEKAARRGVLIALATDFNLPVFFLESEESLADFMVQIATREQLSKKHDHKLQFAKKTEILAEQQQLIIESLPGIGPSTAKALLAHFGSVENVLTADEEELLAAPGVGPERARALKKIVCGDYSPQKESRSPLA